MNSRKLNLWKKILITVSSALLSPLAQAHDSSHTMSQLDHIWAHVAEITGVDTGILLAAVVFTGIFSLAFFTRSRRKIASETHA